MNFSEDWKSLWPIVHAFSPPLLLSGSSAKPLGPVLFIPSPKTLTILFSSPFLCRPNKGPESKSAQTGPLTPLRPNLSPLRSAIQTSKDTYIPSSSIVQSDADTTPLFNNNLQMLRCPDGESLLFFPTEENFDRIGFVVVSPKEPTWEVRLNAEGNIFTTPDGGWDLLSSSAAGDSVVVGFLFAYTMYTIHWFRIEFHSSIISACWSPHLAEESIVNLENGRLFLFDLGFCSGSSNFAEELKGTRISTSWEDFGGDLDSSEKVEWVSCGFAWHPRILIVANSKSVFLVDFIETFDMNNSRGTDRFAAFTMGGSGGFNFIMATKCWLLLFDIRKPLVPVLQWAHGLDNPVCQHNKYTWASESGSAILLGSFWSCEFRLFCYGPPLQAVDGSVASKFSKFCNSLYAWELPSELSLSGLQGYCGDCLLRENFWKTNFPAWIDLQQKKEIVLGFFILGKDLPALLPERDCVDGFTLIRLMSSGKLEIQMYHASFDSPSAKSDSVEGMSLQSENCLLYHSSNQKYKFPRKFKYLKLEYLLANLSNTGPWDGPTEVIPYNQDCNELSWDKFKVAGIDLKGSSLLNGRIFSVISLPTSVHEISLCRLWTGLPVDILRLGVSNQSKLLEALAEWKEVSPTLLDVSNLSQLPPFLFRKSLNHNNKSSHKVHPGDPVLGPLLPLPLLLTLHAMDKEKSCSYSEEEASVDILLTEISHQCNEIIKEANNMTLVGSHSEVNDSYAISLSSDRDEAWIRSQKLKQPKSFFSYRPQAFSNKKGSAMHCGQDEPVFEDEKFTTFVCKMHEKEFAPELNRCSKMHAFPNSDDKPTGLELFDELCPVELKFDRQFSKWQEGCKPYQDF
ncbi:hypothetical protein NE237_021575 [Protea cynaroides]|uniref:Uncharacterized protein n=1 Tax=Protea cynaroides TaxID=273540 RepID=A0A9Q0H9D5_9MAGN|nr:hypothetical protein NE237_021575 [Protea cynaroides]